MNAGLNHNTFRVQLEALLRNPGLKPDMVHVSVVLVLHAKITWSQRLLITVDPKTQFNCVCLGDV